MLACVEVNHANAAQTTLLRSVIRIRIETLLGRSSAQLIALNCENRLETARHLVR